MGDNPYYKDERVKVCIIPKYDVSRLVPPTQLVEIPKREYDQLINIYKNQKGKHYNLKKLQREAKAARTPRKRRGSWIEIIKHEQTQQSRESEESIIRHIR